MTDERKVLVLEPLADDPEVGRWLAALEDARRDTIHELSGVSAEMVDARPDPLLNSIGTLLADNLCRAYRTVRSATIPWLTCPGRLQMIA